MAHPAAASPPNSMVIGIDFGTHASGFGVLRRTPGSVRVTTHDRWPDQPTADAKTRTALLYEGRKPVEWGWTACTRWGKMDSAERRGYSYVENFKLLLEEGGEEGVDTVCPLPCGVTPVQAAADYLGEMRKYIREHVRRTTGVFPRNEETTWCLTVPAIWSDAAKARVRDAAKRAGFTIKYDSRSLLLTLEPEAAALSAACASGSPDPCSSLADGDVLLVLDCGGGTADVTMHVVRGSGPAVRLEEAAVGRGALAGGAHVDSAALSYIRELLGADPWDAWREAHPEELTWFKAKWEVTKRCFAGGTPVALAASSATFAPAALSNGLCTGRLSRFVKLAAVSHHDIRLPLPPGLLDEMGSPVLQALMSAPSSTRGWVSPDRSLVLPAAVVAQRILGPVVDHIVGLMTDVAEEGLYRGNTCNKVLLAGGFARSPYLQARVRQALPAGATLLIPADPGAAVVTGAALFGSQPSHVSARRCRQSYGIAISRPWTKSDAVHAESYGHPVKMWNPEENCFYADGAFECFVQRGQLLTADQVVKYSCCPWSKTATGVAFKLFTTPDTSARYVDDEDMEELAEVVLQLSAGWSRDLSKASEYSVQVEMRFGATELWMTASDPRTKDAVATSIVWNAMGV